MLELTKEQKDFLEKYNLSNNTILDASWMKRSEYSPIMKELEIQIAIGVTPCQKWWHTMRTSFWSCLQCNTQSIAYMTKRNEDAYIYIAGSKKESLLKVWCTKDVNAREKKLNNNYYAWLNDWKMIYSAKYPKSWEIEKKIHTELKKYRYEKNYNCRWKQMISYEIFKCSYKTVKKAFEKIKLELWENKITEEKEISDAESLYNFIEN